MKNDVIIDFMLVKRSNIKTDLLPFLDFKYIFNLS